MLIEANIDALVGPTHHFGGLGVGNVASKEHANQASYPKKAALQGLAKATLIAELGIPQFVWLPPERPQMQLIDSLGCDGEVADKFRQASAVSPSTVSSALSSAFMWAANSCTITPSVDSRDARIYATPANLISSWHRFSEAEERSRDLAYLFQSIDGFHCHAPLSPIVPLRDEGAANHMRLCDSSGVLGVNVFVHGAEEGRDSGASFFPRHTRAASEAIASRHRLELDDVFFLRQHPDAISAGAFHNDVIATSHLSLLLHHEFAFLDEETQLTHLEQRFRAKTGQDLIRREVTDAELPLADAIQSYFFNSQILTPPAKQGAMLLVCPRQCEQIPTAKRLVDSLILDLKIPIDEVRFVDLEESMANGGGPACLRLRVSVTEEQLAAMNGCLRLDAELAGKLGEFIEQRYPDRFTHEDMLDASFLKEALVISREMRRQFAN